MCFVRPENVQIVLFQLFKIGVRLKYFNIIWSSKPIQSERENGINFFHKTWDISPHAGSKNIIHSFEFIIVKAIIIIIIHDKTKVVHKLKLTQLQRQLLQSYFNELVLLKLVGLFLPNVFNASQPAWIYYIVEFETNVNQAKREMLDLEGNAECWPDRWPYSSVCPCGGNHVYSRENLITIN